MKKRVLLSLLCLAPLLMATQCDDDDRQTLFTNNFKAVIIPKSSISVNDTLWIEGRVSSKGFGVIQKDSVFNGNGMADFISVFKFVTPDMVASINTKDALDSFELINDKGDIERGSVCPNADLVIVGALSPDESSYVYRVGFKALQKGDYLLRWNNKNQIVNSDHHTEILSSYLLKMPNQIGFNRCGSFSWTIEKNNLEQEYFFNVK